LPGFRSVFFVSLLFLLFAIVIAVVFIVFPTFRQLIRRTSLALWPGASETFKVVFWAPVRDSFTMAKLLRTAGKGTSGPTGAIRRERCAFIVDFVDVVKNPLLLPSNVGWIGVDDIEGPFTLGHLLA
jgi:hypothetical protein